MKKIGLYIHIPFCKTICVYCAFPVYANKHSQIETYLKKLEQEIIQRGSSSQEYQIDTIYIGGGTPSLLQAEQIENLLQKIHSNFHVDQNTEISIECNPESLSSQKIKHYQKIGINRLSLGVQSLNDKTLWKVARPHNSEQTFQALEIINSAGWKNFGLDLIMGLPYQNLSEFKKEITQLLTYKPTHFSAYFLSYDTKRIDTFIQESPSEKVQVEMYNFLIKKLAQKEFIHYEVSNYAKPGFECRHNLKYWEQQEYLGLGLGAHSYINGKLLENSRDFEKYLAENHQPEKYLLSDEEKRMDLIMLSLRTRQGLDLKNYSQSYGIEETKKLLKSAEIYISTKELILSDNKLTHTEKGYLFADKIYQSLI